MKSALSCFRQDTLYSSSLPLYSVGRHTMFVVALDPWNVAMGRTKVDNVHMPMFTTKPAGLEVLAGDVLCEAGLQNGIGFGTIDWARSVYPQVLTHEDCSTIPQGMVMGLDNPEIVGVWAVRGDESGLLCFPQQGIGIRIFNGLEPGSGSIEEDE